MQDRKKISVKVMEQISKEELESLVKTLSKLEGFEISLNTQIKLS